LECVGYCYSHLNQHTSSTAYEMRIYHCMRERERVATRRTGWTRESFHMFSTLTYSVCICRSRRSIRTSSMKMFYALDKPVEVVVVVGYYMCVCLCMYLNLCFCFVKSGEAKTSVDWKNTYITDSPEYSMCYMYVCFILWLFQSWWYCTFKLVNCFLTVYMRIWSWMLYW